MSDMKTSVSDFLTFQRMARGLAPSSAKLYSSILGRFAAFAGERSTPARAAHRVEPFLIDLGERGLGDHARRKAFEVVRQFYRWACERGRAPVNPLRDSRPPLVHDKPRSFLTRAEVIGLLGVISAGGTMHSQRDAALFSVMFFAGLRVSEVLRLRLRDLASARGLLAVFGKGSKVRHVPIHPELEVILSRWLRARPAGGDILFPSRAAGWKHSGQLDNARVELLLRNVYAPRAGLAGRVTPHTLRRSFATELRRRAVPLEHVQALLGHADIRTTMIYLAESTEGLAESVGKL